MVRHGVNHDIARRHRLVALVVATFVALPMVLVQSSNINVASAATTSTDLRLDVISARTARCGRREATTPARRIRGHASVDPVRRPANTPAGCRRRPRPFTYKWIINADNVGDPHQASPSNGFTPATRVTDGSDVCHPLTPTNPDGDPAFPANCKWASIHPVLSSPVITQGDSDEWDLDDRDHGLPPGKYLVSVSADGFEIGGAHFTVPMSGGRRPGHHQSRAQPVPDPAGHDPGEGLRGFGPGRRHVRRDDGARPRRLECHGQRHPRSGIDRLVRQPDLHRVPAHGPRGRSMASSAAPSDDEPDEALDFYGTGGRARARPFDGGGDPDSSSPMTTTSRGASRWRTAQPIRVPGTGGKCLSDANGIVRIPNMGTNRYSLLSFPPDRCGEPGPLGADHHPRGWPRLGLLDDGQRLRSRHRDGAGRRARALGRVRLCRHEGTPAPSPPTPRRPVRSRAPCWPPSRTSRARAVSSVRAAPTDNPASATRGRSTTCGRPQRLRQRRPGRLRDRERRPTAPSTSRTSRTAPT